MAQASGTSILKDGLKLLSSGALGQIVALLLLYFIGRQYSQESMGVLGTFLAWSGFFTVVAMGRYEQAIVVVRTKGEAFALYRLCLALALLSSLAIAVLTIGATLMTDAEPFGEYALWIAPFVLISAITNATSLLTLRQKAYTRLSISQGLRTVGNNLLKVLFGIRQASAAMLLISSALSVAIGFVPLARLARRAWTKTPSRAEASALLRRHRSFPRFSAPQALIDTLLGSLLILLCPWRYSTAEVGILTMSAMLARRPLLVLSESFGQVYFERLSRAASECSSLWRLMRTPLALIFALGIPASLGLSLWMPHLVRFFVGDGWSGASVVIVCMLPSLVFNFANSIFNVLPDILGRQRAHLFVQVAMLLIELVIILAGSALMPFEAFVRYYYALMIVEQALYFLFLLSLVYRYEKRLKSISK